MNPQPIIIGIDIGMENRTGVAEYLCEKKEFINISSMDIFDALDLCLKYHNDPKYALIVVVENPDRDSNVFGAAEALAKWIKESWVYKKVLTTLISSIRKALAQASNVGKNKGLSKTFIRKLRKYDIKVVEIAPSERDRYPKEVKVGKGKNRKTLKVNGVIQYVPFRQLKMPTKLPKEQFKALCGYDKPTNEHGRDGATMLLGGKKDYFYWSNYARTQKAKKK